VVLVSDRFTGERFLNRHRMIYGTLTEELSSTVHAWRCIPIRLKSGKGFRIRFCIASLSRCGKYRLEIVFATAGAFPVCCVKIYQKRPAGRFVFKMCAVGAFKGKFAREM
jgi:hypothetical protein